jgi:hypothetical protein
VVRHKKCRDLFTPAQKSHPAQHAEIMLSPPSSASSSIMDHNRKPAASSPQGRAPLPGQASSSYYPPTSVSEYTDVNNYLQPPSATPVGGPEPSPPPSLLGQAALSFTSTWITPASTDGFAGAAAGHDGDNGFLDTHFVYEYGRRYHAPASGRVVYPLPNDESEQERDDMKHKLALWMMHEKLLYAPVEDVLKRGGMVLDLGMLFLLLPHLDQLCLAPQSLHSIHTHGLLSQSGQNRPV